MIAKAKAFDYIHVVYVYIVKGESSQRKGAMLFWTSDEKNQCYQSMQFRFEKENWKEEYECLEERYSRGQKRIWKGDSCYQYK